MEKEIINYIREEQPLTVNLIRDRFTYIYSRAKINFFIAHLIRKGILEHNCTITYLGEKEERGYILNEKVLEEENAFGEKASDYPKDKFRF